MSRSIKTPQHVSRSELTEDFLATTLPLSLACQDEEMGIQYRSHTQQQLILDPVPKLRTYSGSPHNRPSSQRAQRMAFQSTQMLRQKIKEFHKSIPHVTAFVTSIRPESGLLQEAEEPSEKGNSSPEGWKSLPPVPTSATQSSKASISPLRTRIHGIERETWERLRKGVAHSTYVAPPFNLAREYLQFQRSALGGAEVHGHNDDGSQALKVVVDCRTHLQTGKNLMEKDLLAPEIPQDYLAPGSQPSNPFYLSHSPDHPDPCLCTKPAGVQELLQSTTVYQTKVNTPTYFVRKSQRRNLLSDSQRPITNHALSKEIVRKNAVCRKAFDRVDVITRRTHSPMLKKLQQQVASRRTPTMLTHTALKETMHIKQELFRMKVKRQEQETLLNSIQQQSQATEIDRQAIAIEEITSEVVCRNRAGIIKREFCVPRV